jgi:hypothetical protein
MLSIIGKNKESEEGLFTLFRKKGPGLFGNMVDTVLTNLYVEGKPDISQAKLPDWVFPDKRAAIKEVPVEKAAEPEDEIPAEEYAVVAASPDMKVFHAHTQTT